MNNNVNTLPCKLKKHKEYPRMFHLVWEDGVVSKDFYNISWANNHLLFPGTKNYKYNHREA